MKNRIFEIGTYCEMDGRLTTSITSTKTDAEFDEDLKNCMKKSTNELLKLDMYVSFSDVVNLAIEKMISYCGYQKLEISKSIIFAEVMIPRTSDLSNSQKESYVSRIEPFAKIIGNDSIESIIQHNDIISEKYNHVN